MLSWLYCPGARDLLSFGPGCTRGWAAVMRRVEVIKQLPIPVPCVDLGALHPPRPPLSISFLLTHCFPGFASLSQAWNELRMTFQVEIVHFFPN